MLNQIRLTALLLLFFINVHAQNVWSLQQCIDYALKNNISIKQSEINNAINKGSIQTSVGSMMPSLNGSGNYNFNFGRNVDPYTYQFTNEEIRSANGSLNANLTLFNGFELQNTLKKSKLDYLAGKYDTDKIRNDVSLNVATSYLQILYAKEQLKLAGDRVDAAIKNRNRMKALVDGGSMAKGSLMETEAQLASEELAKVTAENTLKSAQLSLTQLLQLDSVAYIEIEVPALDVPEQSTLALTVEEIFSASLANLPEIKSAEYKMQSAEKAVSIANGGRLPRLSMFGSLSSGYSSQTRKAIFGVPTGEFSPSGNIAVNQTFDTSYVFAPLISDTRFEDTPFNNQIKNNLSKSVGISINVPLFNGFQVNNNVRRAKLNLENSKLQKQLTYNTVFKSVQQAQNDAIAANNQYKASQKNAEAMQESFIYTEKKYNAGMANNYEYTLARNNLTKAQSDMLQSKYDFIFKLKVVDFYMGRPMSF